MIQIPVVKIIAYSLIPKIVHDCYKAGKKLYNETYIFSEPPPKKKSDRSPWTKHRFDTVMRMRKNWLRHNELTLDNKPLSVLITDINIALHMNKSRRAIAAVWEGKIDREKLPNANKK